jgi:3-oxoadipate enol-lactonase
MTLAHDFEGSGPADTAVVLLHSTVCDRRMWDALAGRLTAAGHRVLRADFRGYGGTPAGTAPYSDAEDIEALLDMYGVTRPALVGASYGGRVALELALARPARPAALALLCPALPGQDEGAALLAFEEREERLYDEGDLEGAAALSARTWLGPGAGPETLAAVTAMQLQAYRLVPEDDPGHHGAGEYDPAGAAALTAPALVLSGAHDFPEFRANADRLAALLPAAEARELPWAGHLPVLERPEETGALLADFLRRALGAPVPAGA